MNGPTGMNLIAPLVTGYHYLRQPRLLRDLPLYWWLARKNIRRHRVLTKEALAAARTSDTLFIFGSGWSLNNITPEEWRHIATCQTLGFNWFIRQDFVRMDFHLVKEAASNDADPAVWRPQLQEYSERIDANPLYRDTILVMQSGPQAINANRLLGLGWLKEGRRLFPCAFISRGVSREPTRRFDEGLAHACGTLSSCVNFAFLMGYRKIVLTGVDLNDRRYFWLRQEETRDADAARGASHTDRHNMADAALDTFGRWTHWLEERGVTLFCYNPHSLLAEVMPVYDSPARRLPRATA